MDLFDQNQIKKFQIHPKILGKKKLKIPKSSKGSKKYTNFNVGKML